MSLLTPFVLGLLVGRWWFLFPLAGILIGFAVFLKINNGWHGAGWGDGGIFLNLIWAALTLGLGALGIALGRGAKGVA